MNRLQHWWNRLRGKPEEPPPLTTADRIKALRDVKQKSPGIRITDDPPEDQPPPN